MNNYNWLFDLGDTTRMSMSNPQNVSMMSETHNSTRDHQMDNMQYQSTAPPPADEFGLDNRTTSADTISRQPAVPQHSSSEAFQAPDVYHFNSMSAPNAGIASTGSPSPVESNRSGNPTSEVDFSPPTTTSPDSMHTQAANPANPHSSLFNMQTLPPAQPRRSMPTMDEVSRNQILDLLVAARPKTPEGTEISRDHPLLSISSMQNYLDLFFSRFNVAYPLLHQATFDPSQTEPLLLLAVLLLGATYSEKAIHRLAVCIHDVLRAQIFQHTAFSSTPELWMLQTILLVECFGKSRAGQKQHDMAHLFHGLLIK